MECVRTAGLRACSSSSKVGSSLTHIPPILPPLLPLLLPLLLFALPTAPPASPLCSSHCSSLISHDLMTSTSLFSNQDAQNHEGDLFSCLHKYRVLFSNEPLQDECLKVLHHLICWSSSKVECKCFSGQMEEKLPARFKKHDFGHSWYLFSHAHKRQKRRGLHRAEKDWMVITWWRGRSNKARFAPSVFPHPGLRYPRPCSSSSPSDWVKFTTDHQSNHHSHHHCRIYPEASATSHHSSKKKNYLLIKIYLLLRVQIKIIITNK